MIKDAALAQRVEDALTAQYALPNWELCDERQFAEDTRAALQVDDRWLDERRRRQTFEQAFNKALSTTQPPQKDDGQTPLPLTQCTAPK